jgi:gamma-glutamyltranspeptidase/glutathione hydrolase
VRSRLAAQVSSRLIRRIPGKAALLALSATLSACSGANSLDSALFGPPSPALGQPGHVRGFLGAVVADEPQAALAARQVLSAGGNAADAAVALGMTLSVTLPSRAGLGGGGACLAYMASRKSVNEGVPEAVLFMPKAATGASGDRPAAVPMLARGLYALHARYGTRPFDSLIAPAERMARLGIPVSRALANDLAAVWQPLSQDPNARAAFGQGGAMPREGDRLIQPDLGATLAQLGQAGVGDLYQGGLARRLESASALAGGPITLTDLRGALPALQPALIVPYGHDRVAFLPPPADGGLAAAAAFETLAANPTAIQDAAVRALAVAARWRQGGIDSATILKESLPSGILPPLPASTGFAVLDRDGNAVACDVTMGNLFGTGRIAPGTGILLGASPASSPLPLISAAIAWNPNIHGFRAAVTGSGQEGAAMAVGYGMFETLRSGQTLPNPVPEPGRANGIGCNRYLPDSEGSCSWAVDPRGSGLAVGSS